MAAWEVDDNDSNDLLRAPEEVPAVSEFEAWLVKRWPLNSSEDSFDTPPETVSKCEAIPGSSETWSWSWSGVALSGTRNSDEERANLPSGVECWL